MPRKTPKPPLPGDEGRMTMAVILWAMKGECECKACVVLRELGESMIKEVG